MVEAQDGTREGCIVVLGATGGIGSALAAEIGASSLVLDARRAAEVQDGLDMAVERLGRVDGVANCVGSLLLKPAHLTSQDEFDDTVTCPPDSRSRSRVRMLDDGRVEGSADGTQEELHAGGDRHQAATGRGSNGEGAGGRAGMQGSWDHRADLLSVRREYGGLGVDQAKRLKTLEAENARLKRVVAD
jgi:hypothetical protein